MWIPIKIVQTSFKMILFFILIVTAKDSKEMTTQGSYPKKYVSKKKPKSIIQQFLRRLRLLSKTKLLRILFEKNILKKKIFANSFYNDSSENDKQVEQYMMIRILGNKQF